MAVQQEDPENVQQGRKYGQIIDETKGPKRRKREKRYIKAHTGISKYL